MRILVEEEYGFKYWVWEIEDTVDSIVAHFNEVTSEENYYSGTSKGGVEEQFNGSWEQIEWEQFRVMCDAGNYDMLAHVHTNDDSNIMGDRR